jgi:DNA-binding transcriptional ArsR family regulator
MRAIFHPAAEDIQLPTVLYALSDPIRLDIVRRLAASGEEACGHIDIPIPSSTLSHHYKVLRESGITRTRLEGTQRFISLREDDLNRRFPGLLQAVLAALGEREGTAAANFPAADSGVASGKS